MCRSLSALSGGSTCWLFASGVFCGTFTCSALVRSRGLCRYHTRSLELAGLRRCSNCWFAVIYRSILAAILSSFFPVLRLRRRRWRVLFMRIGFFLRSRFPSDASGTVKTSARSCVVVIHHRLGVNVVDYGHIHVAYRAIVEEISALPVSTRKPDPNVTKSVINSTVETDLGSPVAAIPGVHSVIPSPITGCPQETGSRC